MKKITLFIILILSLYGCEKDDICIDPITPNLIVRFYDITDATILKKITNLQIKNIDIDSIYINNFPTGDSILFPLNINQDITKYVLTLNSTDEVLANSDTISISYTREPIFVSRSCGFKTTFKNISVSVTDDTNNWIQLIETIETPQNVDNESQAHVKILH
ncbi:MAG: DUF6452 family protein [Flavobacteriaceae bacterium]|nr:DUF6452 family protein [Flavobacteriaceae bacterium]